MVQGSDEYPTLRHDGISVLKAWSQDKDASFTDTIRQLIDNGAGDAAVLNAPGRFAMTHGRLAVLADTIVRDQNARGIGHGDRVAIALPNGPEMAAAYLATCSGATTAPPNTAYREEEFEFTLADLNAKALVVEAGSVSPTRLAAAKRGLAVLEIEAAAGSAAGDFRFAADAPADAAPAQFIRSTLNLIKDDNRLNIIILFHIHGLIALYCRRLRENRRDRNSQAQRVLRLRGQSKRQRRSLCR